MLREFVSVPLPTFSDPRARPTFSDGPIFSGRQSEHYWKILDTAIVKSWNHTLPENFFDDVSTEPSDSEARAEELEQQEELAALSDLGSDSPFGSVHDLVSRSTTRTCSS